MIILKAEYSSFFFSLKRPLENFTCKFNVKHFLSFGLFPLHHVFLALSILSAICDFKHLFYKGIS